jgi:hypothetical protein
MKRNVYTVRLEPARIIATEISDDAAAALFSQGHSILLATQEELIQLARREHRALVVLDRDMTSDASNTRAAALVLEEPRAAQASGGAIVAGSAAHRCPGPAMSMLEVVGKTHQLLRRHFARALQLRMTMSPNGILLQGHCGSRADEQRVQQQLLNLVPVEPPIRSVKAC